MYQTTALSISHTFHNQTRHQVLVLRGFTNIGSWHFFQIHKCKWLAGIQLLCETDVEHFRFLAKGLWSQTAELLWKREMAEVLAHLASLLNRLNPHNELQLLTTRWKPRFNLLALLGSLKYHSVRPFWKTHQIKSATEANGDFTGEINSASIGLKSQLHLLKKSPATF